MVIAVDADDRTIMSLIFLSILNLSHLLTTLVAPRLDLQLNAHRRIT